MVSPYQNPYDFVIVGAGPAGCILARRLARSQKRPRVVLIEAGGRNDNKNDRVDADRWFTGKIYPDHNWNYKTVPQKSLNARVLDYDRGKGIGGSSAINFCVWTVASRDDHDFVSRLVNDPEWQWKHAQERYKRIETYHFQKEHVPEVSSKYLAPKSEDHGSSGPICIGHPLIWEDSLARELDNFIESGYRANPDGNSGNPIGFSTTPNTAFRGVRSTAGDALRDCPDNLEILTDTTVARVLFQDKTAVGVETLDGRVIRASKEVILCCGTIDSPKILIHSGIGPAEQLEKFNIKVVDQNEAIGKNLQDHPYSYSSWPRKENLHKRLEYWGSVEEQRKAREMWERNGTGPLAEMVCQSGIGWLKDDHILESGEFKQLPQHVRDHIAAPTTPHYEVVVNALNFDFILDLSKAPVSSATIVFVMNPQSCGSVSLASSNPADPINIDLNMLSHPYDQRVMIEAIRTLCKIFDAEPSTKIDGVQYVMPPSSASDDDILAFCRATSNTTLHATGTVKMGKDFSDPSVCVNNGFQVRNVSRLRVADMSVWPVLPSIHTQSSAYLAGLMLGDKLAQEYNLGLEDLPS